MSKNKVNIDEEIKVSEEQVKEIADGTDTKKESKEATEITNVYINIWDKEYKYDELTEIMNKKEKTSFEKELIKKFERLMKNYYIGIVHVSLHICCGQAWTIEDLKNKLKEKDMYEIIDTRCSNDKIRFNKATVDTIIKYAEKNIEG